MKDSNGDGEVVRVMQGNEKGALWLCLFVLALLMCVALLMHVGLVDSSRPCLLVSALWMGVGLIDAC